MRFTNSVYIYRNQVKGLSIGSGSWTISTLIDHFMVQSTSRNIAYDYVSLLIFQQSMKFGYYTTSSTTDIKLKIITCLWNTKVNFLITCFKKAITEIYAELQVKN